MANDQLISIPQILSDRSRVGSNIISLTTASDCRLFTECASEFSCPNFDDPCSGDACPNYCSCDNYTPCSCNSYTPAPTPGAGGTITLVSKTKNSITISFDAISNASTYEIWYHEDTSDFTDHTDYISYKSQHTLEDTLTENTTWVINYRGVNSEGKRGAFGTSIRVTLSQLSPWDWSISNGGASATQTQNAYTAVTTKGPLTDFSYLVWNDLCAKVKEYVEVKGFSWESHPLSYNNTIMTSSDKNVTADRMNSLRYNVWTGYNNVSAGDIIYGSIFTELTESLNRGIALL